MNRIETSLTPMIAPLKAAVQMKELAVDSNAKQQDDLTILENRREIKSQTHYEKGIFLDIYV